MEACEKGFFSGERRGARPVVSSRRAARRRPAASSQAFRETPARNVCGRLWRRRSASGFVMAAALLLCAGPWSTASLAQTEDMDGANQAATETMLDRFGTAVAEQVFDSMKQRFDAPRVSSVQEPFAGYRLGARSAAGAAPASGLSSGRELLRASSFSLTHGASGSALTSVWGRGSHTSFEDRRGALEVEGGVSTGQFGVDWSSGAWLLGLSAAHSRNEGDYTQTDAGDAGDVDAALTGLYPYLGYRITERLSAWGTLGYGEASLTFKPQGGDEIKTDMDTRMGAAGLRGDVLRPGASGGFSLALRADAVFVRTRSDEVAGSLAATSNNTRRLRFGLESSHNFVFESGARLSPVIELGILSDDGDLEDGTGTDIEAGLVYAGTGGFSVDLRVRSLVTHEVSGRKEWGVSGMLRYDPAPASELGLALSLNSGYGVRASGGVEESFALDLSDGIENLGDDAPSAGRLEAELGYGLSVPGGLYAGTPWARFGLSEGRSSWRLGWRFTPLTERAPELSTGLEYGGRGGGNEIRLRLDARF